MNTQIKMMEHNYYENACFISDYIHAVRTNNDMFIKIDSGLFTVNPLAYTGIFVL